MLLHVMLSDSDTCIAVRMQCDEHLYDNLGDPSLPLRVTITKHIKEIE